MKQRPSYSVYFNLVFILILFVIIQAMLLIFAPALRAKNLINDRMNGFQNRYLYTDCTYHDTVNLNTSVITAFCSLDGRSHFVAMDDESTLLGLLEWTPDNYETQMNGIRTNLTLTQEARIQLTHQDEAWIILVQDEVYVYAYAYETLSNVWKVRLK